MALLYKCIDTMKLSRDRNNLTNSQITEFISQYTGLGLTHLTVDATLDGSSHSAAYVSNWVNAIRSAGMKVWFRPAVNNPYGGTIQNLIDKVAQPFIDHPEFFANGDIYDMLPESTAFTAMFGSNDTDKKANWNQFLRDSYDNLNTVAAGAGFNDIEFGITSITDFNVKNYVEAATFTKLGYATMDDYNIDNTLNPTEAAGRVIASLTDLHNVAGVPVVVGEFGFTRSYDSSQSLQREILRQVWNGLSKLSWLAGYNYWCGHGGVGYGDYCNLFEPVGANWYPRAALTTIGEFYTYGRCTRRMTVI